MNYPAGITPALGELCHTQLFVNTTAGLKDVVSFSQSFEGDLFFWFQFPIRDWFLEAL